MRHFSLPCLLLMVLVLLPACRTVPPPALDFSDPGWKVRHGQAVWRTGRGNPELAGELLYARHADGRAVMQFTKTPIPFLLASLDGKRWSIRIIPQNKSFSGGGKIPKRMLWLQLAQSLEGRPFDSGLVFEQGDGSWRIENPGSGEAIEGFLEP